MTTLIWQAFMLFETDNFFPRNCHQWTKQFWYVTECQARYSFVWVMQAKIIFQERDRRHGPLKCYGSQMRSYYRRYGSIISCVNVQMLSYPQAFLLTRSVLALSQKRFYKP